MFDFSLAELKQRISAKVKDLHATSSSPLAQAVQWSCQPDPLITALTAVQIQTTQAKDHVFDSSDQTF